VSILNDILDTVSSVTPEKGFPALKIQTAAALPVERVNHVCDFLKAQVFIATSGYPAVSAPQIALVGQYEAANEGDTLLEQMMTQYVLDAPCYGFHGQPLPSFSCFGLM
jgi:hypothetical protein